MTDDEITELVIRQATSRFRYGQEELSCTVAGIITDLLAIEDEHIDCDLVDEWQRQFRLAIRNTVGFARAIAQRQKELAGNG